MDNTPAALVRLRITLDFDIATTTSIGDSIHLAGKLAEQVSHPAGRRPIRSCEQALDVLAYVASEHANMGDDAILVRASGRNNMPADLAKEGDRVAA